MDFFGAPIPGSYFLDLRSYDPAKVAAGLKIPILVLQGGHDYQVTNADFEIWKKALAGDPHATFKFYPNYTHLFMPGAGSGPASPDDYSVAGNVSEMSSPTSPNGSSPTRLTDRHAPATRFVAPA